MVCWAYLRGCGEKHSDKIKPMPQEGGKMYTWRCTGIHFGWILKDQIRENRIADISASKTEEVSIDLSLLGKEWMNNITKNYSQVIRVYRDASKNGQNRVHIAFVISDLQIELNKSVNDNLGVYTVKLLAICTAFCRASIGHWTWCKTSGQVKCSKHQNSIALVKNKHNQSDARQYIILGSTYAARNNESRSRGQAHLFPGT